MGRCAIIAPTSLASVTYATATEAQRNAYGFISDNTEKMPTDGSDGYAINCVSGQSNTTNANDTNSASGILKYEGTSATTNANDSSNAIGAVIVIGSSATTNDDDISSASGIVQDKIEGTIAVTNADDTSTGSAIRLKGFNLLKRDVGRKPISIIEIDLDTCQNTFGVSPCTASGAAGTECYNTFETCQDTPNYVVGTKTYKFSTDDALPLVGENIIPCMKSVQFAPTKLTQLNGLGNRAKATVTMSDFPHHDRGIDPYVSTRNYTPEDQGTFFGKLLARNPFYYQREMQIKTGYITKPLDLVTSFQTRLYQIDRFEGPNGDGNYRIIGRDPLALIDDKKSQCPVASEGSLSAGITDTATSLTLTPSGAGDDYDASGYVRINDEIIAYASKTSDTLNSLTRAQWGTTADSHDSGDLVQLCKSWTDENVIDVVYELMTTYANVPTSYIVFSDWEAERDLWLLSYNLTNILSEPTGVAQLVSEIMIACGIQIWWDEVNQEIKLEAEMPKQANTELEVFCDDKHVLRRSSQIKDDQALRLTQVWVYYGPQDYTQGNEQDNFSRLKISANATAESTDEFGTKEIKKFFVRWFDDTNDGEAGQLSSRTLNRYVATPKRLKFTIDMKDSDLMTGDHFIMRNHTVQDVDGSNREIEMQVLSANEKEPGTFIDIEALTFNFAQRYAWIAPTSLASLTYDNATDAERSQYGFIALDTGLMPDGTEGYAIA